MPTAIVAVSADGVIGVDGGLPWHYPEDLKRFKRLTLGGTVIMGRKTWESLGRKPLPGRRNVVISRQDVEHVESFTSIAEAINSCREPLWIIGGAQIYLAALEYCDSLDITYVPEVVGRDDAVRFPELDPTTWHEAEQSTNPVDPRLRHVRMERVSKQV